MPPWGVGAQPQGPLLVLDQFKIVDDAVRRDRLVNYETSGRRIETIETIVGGDPERSIVIDKKTGHDVVAQTVWISRIVTVGLEFPCAPVKTEQPMVISSSPDIAGRVFANGDHIGTDGWSGGAAVGSVAPGLAVESIECFERTDPQDPLMILVDCANKGFSRTLRTVEMRNCLERQRVGRKVDYPHRTQANPDAPFAIRK